MKLYNDIVTFIKLTFGKQSKTKCFLCHSIQGQVIATNILDGAEKYLNPNPKGLDVIKCLHCGIFYFSPQPTNDELISYHNKQYFISESPEKQTGYPNYIEENHRKVKIEWGIQMIDWLYRIDDTTAVERKALDVGCATGFTTYGMSKFPLCKVTAVGVDVSEWAIEYGHNWMAKQDKPMPLFCGRLCDVDLSRYTPFDYIIFWDSLEHDVNPSEVIKIASTLLKDNGLILIHTPDGLKATRDWYYWSPHQHSCIFTIDSITALFYKYGIKTIKQRLSSEADEIIIVAQKHA